MLGRFAQSATVHRPNIRGSRRVPKHVGSIRRHGQCSTHEHEHAPVSPSGTPDSPNLREKIKAGPSLADFMRGNDAGLTEEELIPPKIPYVDYDPSSFGNGRTVHVETYGCQMNVSDTEIVYSVMKNAGFVKVDEPEAADVVFLNTCAVRDHAEQKIWSRLGQLRAQKKQRGQVIGVLGCMAERLKESLIEREKLVDLVAGPDAYRDLPRLLGVVEGGNKAINVILSQDETYADISPVRTSADGVSAFVYVLDRSD